jgi:nitrite reductase/ring-hydroxylating ferredoxin subunit
LRAAGFYCVIAGCIGAVAAAAPGILDWLIVVPPNSSAKSRGLLHGGLNVFCLVLFIVIAYRLGSPSSPPDKLTLFLMAVGVAVLGASSWLGGTLVFRNQIGVDHRYAGSGKFKTRSLPNWSRPVCHQSELGDGQMLLANVGTERVVIGRCSEGLFAFGDSCTHKGGSLSDGALVGCTVQCPWHGSQFDVRNGRVIAGPAEDKIKIYSIETRNGEVYVKSPDVPSIGTKKAA